MRILTEEEMMAVSGGKGLDSPGRSDANYGGRNTDFGASRGPQSRGGRRNDGRNAAMDSYLGTDVYGANAIGLSAPVGRAAVAGVIGGLAGGIKGAILGGAAAAWGAGAAGFTTPSPSNRGGGGINSGGRERGGGDSGGRGSR